VFFDFVYNFDLKPNSFCEVFSELSYAFIRIHVKYPLFLSDLMKLEFYRQNFEKYLNVKLPGNLSIGCRVPCGRTDRQDEAMGRRYLQAKAEAAISTKVWAEISLNYFTVSGSHLAFEHVILTLPWLHVNTRL
jgi:hypothetical protein